MKTKFPFLLAALALSLSVQAQFIEPVTYRGAFAPAPVAQWTDNWVNWDPQNAAYPATNTTVTGSITANTTWTSNNVYLLSGVVYVNDGVTLTIQPGTIIRAVTGTNSSLLVARGGKLMAEGTACNPIVFTSNQPVGSRSQGNWGGVLLLGKGLNNRGTQVQIEGLSSADPRNFHGGTDNADNSGVLRYVRIEFGGFIFSANNEINGLTMGSVGNGTTIDYVQTSFVNDDAFEWFGGAVNCKHLIAYRNIDDDFDTDNGYSGQLQYLLGIKDPALFDASTSNGFESDNDAAGSENQPKTSASFYNVTQIGAYRCTTPPPSADPLHNRGAHLRRSTELKVYNSIFMNFRNGLFIDGAAAANNANSGLLIFRNNIIAGNYTLNTSHRVAEDAATRAIFLNPANNNDSINTCNLLINAFPLNFQNPDFRPVASDLIPIIEIDNVLFTPNQAKDFIVDIIENGVGATSGPVSFTIGKLPGFDITVPGLTLTGTNQSGINSNSNVNGSTPNSNSNWLFRDNGSSIVVTSKPGVVIAQSDLAVIGFTAIRKSSTASGVNQTLVVNIVDGSGQDNSAGNNATLVGFSTSN